MIQLFQYTKNTLNWLKTSPLLLCGMLFFATMGMAQQGKKEVYKVSGKKNAYQFFPTDKYLFAGVKNKLIVRKVGDTCSFQLKIANGQVKMINDSVFTISGVSRSAKEVVVMIEERRKGKMVPVYQEKFTVIDYPVIEWSGIKCDSFAPLMLAAIGSFSANYKKLGVKTKVVGFKMDIYENGQWRCDSTEGNSLTISMKKYIATLKQNQIIYFKQIKYYQMDGSLAVCPFFRMFLIQDNIPTSFGVGQ